MAGARIVNCPEPVIVHGPNRYAGPRYADPPQRLSLPTPRAGQ